MSIREVWIHYNEDGVTKSTEFPYNQKVFWEFSFELKEGEFEKFWENNSASYEAIMTKDQLIKFIKKVYGSKTGDDRFDKLVDSLDNDAKCNIISYEV